MSLPERLPSLYLIADPAVSGPDRLIPAVRRSLEVGVKMVQYREKSGTRRARLEGARRLRNLTRKHGALLIINDEADLALAVGADGVHLGQEDLPLRYARKILGGEKIIGISTHNLWEAEEAARQGANYLGLGPAYPTPSKVSDRPTLGVPGIAFVARRVSLPVYAIGGIGAEQAEALVRAGAHGIAVISAVLTADHPEEVVRLLLRRLEIAGA